MAASYHYTDRRSSATLIKPILTLVAMVKTNSIALALAGNVQRLMDHHGLSQAQLAKKSGVGQSTLSGLLDSNKADERNPRSSTIDKLAEFFKVEPWQLVVPGLHIELLLNQQIARVIYNFNDAPDPGRANIDRIAESEVRYAHIGQQLKGARN